VLLVATTLLLASAIAWWAGPKPWRRYAPPILIEPLATGTEINPDYFGTHLHRLVLIGPPTEVQIVPTPWPEGQIHAIRMWDTRTRWADLEPAKGQWRFDRLDRYVETAAAKGASVLFTLGSPPRWASARPDEDCPYGLGCSAEPRNLKDWEDYVRVVARRYKGRIAVYELWNEPKFTEFSRDIGTRGFYTGSLTTMLEMARIARRVLHEEDPEAGLATPGFVNGVDRLERFLADGGAKLVDVVTYHFYSDSARGFAKQVNDVRAAMRRQNVGHLQLWNTESGVEVYEEGERTPEGIVRYGRVEAAAITAHTVILGAFMGLQRFFHYAWDSERTGMQTPNGLGRTPSAPMWAQLHRWLVGARPRGCREQANDILRCEAELPGETLILLSHLKHSGPITVTVDTGGARVRVERAIGEVLPACAGNTCAIPVDAMPVAVFVSRI
jgi:Beta-galactosidase